VSSTPPTVVNQAFVVAVTLTHPQAGLLGDVTESQVIKTVICCCHWTINYCSDSFIYC